MHTHKRTLQLYSTYKAYMYICAPPLGRRMYFGKGVLYVATHTNTHSHTLKHFANKYKLKSIPLVPLVYIIFNLVRSLALSFFLSLRLPHTMWIYVCMVWHKTFFLSPFGFPFAFRCCTISRIGNVRCVVRL